MQLDSPKLQYHAVISATEPKFVCLSLCYYGVTCWL